MDNFIHYKKLLVSKIRYLCELINNIINMNQKLDILKQLLAAFIVIASIAGFSSCEKYTYIPEVIDPVIPVHFQAEIQPIFNGICITCHGATKAPDLRDGKSYDALTKGGYVDQPGATSKLYTIMTGQDHSPRSTPTEKQLVLNWINQGALDN
jgi:hypothetical protein